MTCAYDPVWEDIYARGHKQWAPWDAVVTFLFRNAPPPRAKKKIQVLEVGCGTASNLFFAAQMGFSVTGVDASASAIAVARERFAREGLSVRLEICDFTHLPFSDEEFDLVIDRGAITCVAPKGAGKCVREVARVIKAGGRFFFNPYSDRSSSAASGERSDGRHIPGGLRKDIEEGTLTGVGQICFYGLSDIAALLDQDAWRILQLQHMEWFDCLHPLRETHAEYRIVAERNGARERASEA
jgi:SAM-dependent methyltransferase